MPAMELDSLICILQLTHHTLLSQMDLNIAIDNMRDKSLHRGCLSFCLVGNRVTESSV